MAQATAAATPGINRREFLFYIWGASLALFAAEATGLILWFMLPRFREGEFGGKFPIEDLDAILPDVNAPPVSNVEGRFWLVNLDTSQPNKLMYAAEGDPTGGIQGVAAIYKVCTHLGCIYAWNAANDRFECPCHGSKYRLDGRRIEDPAPRTLDRFKIEALDANDTILAESQLVDGFYQPLVLPAGTVKLNVDTGDKKQGPSQQLLCNVFDTC
jgi:cytochrome b6-f complex iron-sulfur subunit